MATVSESDTKPTGTQDAPAETFTLPKGSPALPPAMEQWQTGDQVMIPATIQAIDDAGVTFAPNGEVTKQDAEPEPAKGDGDEGTGNPQVDYVTKQRRGMMGEMGE